MTDTTVSDALVWPQDDGSGVPDGSEDYDSAGYLSLLAKYSGDGSYIGLDENGDPTLQFANVDTTNEEVDINTGFAYIMDGTHVVQSGSQTTYDTTLPNNTPYVVILPTAVSNLTLDTDATNDIWLAVDPTANDSVYLRHGTGLSAPSDPSVKVGTVNTSSGETTRANDGPVQTSREITTDDATINTSLDYAGHAISALLEADASGLRMERGEVTIAGADAASDGTWDTSNFVNGSVTFTTAFSAAPIVVLSGRVRGDGTSIFDYRNVSTTGFDATNINFSTSAGDSNTLQWIAVGPE